MPSWDSYMIKDIFTSRIVHASAQHCLLWICGIMYRDVPGMEWFQVIVELRYTSSFDLELPSVSLNVCDSGVVFERRI